jgi:hypothetical protein
MRDLLKRLMSGLRGQSVTDTAAERGAADRAGASEASAAAEQERVPPDAVRVAARALVLTAVTARGQIERADDKGRAEEHRRDICHWLDHLDIAREIEPSEHALIRAPVGSLDQQSMTDAVWRGEAIVPLAWSLGRTELPHCDEMCDSFEVAKRLGFLREGPSTALARPSLRPPADIAHWANTYLTLHWRLKQFSISQDRIPFADYVAWATWGPLTVAELDLLDGDLAVQGERIDRISRDQYDRATSIARERHKAFNWLLGFVRIYSLVRTST